MSATELYGLLLAVGVLAVALALGGWHWADLRRPSASGSDDEAAHRAFQTTRRWAMSGVMALLAALIFVGSRTGHRVGDRPNPVFIGVWLAVSALVVLLLILAAVDWLSIRRLARRQRSEIVREGMELLKQELRERAARPSNGRANHDLNGRNVE